MTPVFQVLSGSPPAPTGQQACPQVSGTRVATQNPVFSPQGTAIAFDEPGPNTQNLYTYDVSMSGDVGLMNTVTDLTPNFATDVQPSWGPVFPGTSTPEVPLALLLPAAGGGLFGVASLLAARRRRRLSA